MSDAIVTYLIERATTYLPQLLHVALQISSILRLAEVLWPLQFSSTKKVNFRIA